MSKPIIVLLPVLFAGFLAGSLAGCLVDSSLELENEVQPLAAGFSNVVASEAGFDHHRGAIARLSWSGPACDANCIVEFNGGFGWEKLVAGQHFSFLDPWTIETAGLSTGGNYSFRVTTPGTPGQVKDLGNGISSSTPGYPGETSPIAHLHVDQGPANVLVKILNRGLPRVGGAIPSPFFNQIHPSSGQYVPNIITDADLSYAFVDGNGDGEALQTPFGFAEYKLNDGTILSASKVGHYGPAQSVSFYGNGAAIEWQPIHSDLLANDGSHLANLVVMARIRTWQTIDRPQFVAVHIAIDKQTGHAHAPVAILGGDIGTSDPVDQRMILRTEPGEPPTLKQWDWMPNPSGLPRVVGEVEGTIRFRNPNGGLPYEADVAFWFDVDVNTVR